MSNWPKISLAELTAKRPICYGVLKPGEHHSSGVPLIRVTDIRDNHLNISKIYRISKELSDSFNRSILKGGEVLLSIQGTVGRVALCPREMAGANVSRTIAVIEPDERVSRAYLRYWLLSEVSNFKVGGSTRASFNIGDIRKLEISIPPLSEQNRIVAILDEAFEGIDTVFANTEKNLANVRELFESYAKKIFSKNAEEWGKKRLGDIGCNLDSRRVPITKAKRKAGDIPYYGASGVVDYVDGHIFDEDLLLISEDGANLLARTYPIAFSISGKSWVNNHAHVIRFDDLVSQRFVEYYLNSISLAPYVSGMAQPKLNQKSLNSIIVPFPSVSEQESLVNRLDELSMSQQQLVSIYQQKLAALAELKQSMLKKAFSGELTATEAEAAVAEATA